MTNCSASKSPTTAPARRNTTSGSCARDGTTADRKPTQRGLRKSLWFAPRSNESALGGNILELACGTGLWTERLLPSADRITAVDAAPETLELNRQRVHSPMVTYVEADLFAWRPPERYDAVFFGFWLSHVPPERFDAFWRMVADSLKPGGRTFFVDSKYQPESTARDHAPVDPAASTALRRLNDGREFRVVKIFYDPEELRARLARLGWNATVDATPKYFLYGEASKPRNAGTVGC